jgi:HEAT repeat protein/tetratricopeptide (TPR) repeat protein
VRIDSQDPAHLIALGGQQLAEGRRDEAVATFRRILGVVRDRGEAHGMLAGVFADHDMLDLAEAEYRKASEADPDDLRHLRGLAGVLERAREGESIGDRQRRDLEAIETWQKVVALSGDDRPARREARRRIVGIWERRHQLRQRVAEWERAFAATPPDVEAGRFLAEARLRGRPPDTAAAAAILARISELEPGDVETLLALERTRTAQGDRVGAIDALRRLALADARRAPQYLQRMAEHAHALYRDDEAVRYAEEAVRRTPDDAEAHRRLGDLYRARQDTEHAVSSYQRAIELNDRLFATYFELAEIHVAAGRAAEADRLYREVLRLCPDDDLVSRAGRASMQVHLGAGTLETLERELLPLALSNPRRPIFRRMLVELYDGLTAPWLQDLNHPDRARAEAARAHLDRLGNRALKPLLEALADDDPTQRRIAIDVLGYLRNENAAGPLLAAAEADGPLDLRLRALSGAGALSGEALLTRYEAIARGPERRLQAVATWAIARIGGRRAVPTLRALLTHGDPDVRAFAILGLGHAHDRASTDALGHLLTADRSRVVQAATAWALGLIGDADDIAILALALERGDPKVRAAAALALGRIGRAPARAALADALFNADPGERTAAIAALARMSEERPDETLELPLLGSRTSASTYLELLLRVPQASTVVLDGEMSEVFEAAANKALGGPVERVTAALRLLTGRGAAQLVVIGSDAGRDRLLETLGPKVLEAGDHPSAEVRVLAVEVAAELGTQEAGSLLARRLDDDDPRVVRAVLGCVGIAQRSEHVVDRIEAIARGHRDWAMRLAAVEALGRVDPEGATDTLAGIVERDDFAFVREAAVLALGRAANERARAALERVVARDAEAHVRAAAARLLAPVEASGT